MKTHEHNNPRRVLALGLSASLLLSLAPATFALNEEPGTEAPQAAYEYTFEDGTVTEKAVSNAGSVSEAAATIGGEAAVEQDSTLGSQVLALPGNGTNRGFLTLPASLYENVSDGFTISLWVNIDGSAPTYSRVFSSTNEEPNSDTEGTYKSPEFAFVTGNGNTDYHTSVRLDDTETQMKLTWDPGFTANQWQYLTVTVSSSAYTVYLNGEAVEINDKNNNMADVCEALFESGAAVLKAYDNNSIGQSIYADNDLKGKVDDVSFYNEALTANQVAAVYAGYVDADKLNELTALVATAKEKQSSEYTSETYQVLRTAIGSAETVAENPVSTANIEAQLAALQSAIDALEDKETGGNPPSEEVPQAYYEFTFDGETVDNKTVSNQGSKTGASATIGGGAAVENDPARASNVLDLPGGSIGAGYLTLPNDMYSEVNNTGFAFSFWIDIDESADHYNRIFSSTSNAFNAEGYPFNAPEFTFVVGGTDTASSAYDTSIMLKDRTTQMKLMWNPQFTKGRWQHVTVSVSPTAYDVYLDGEKVAVTDKNGNMETVLDKLFENSATALKEYVHNSIGQSVYNTDSDLKAKIDEFRFYNTALTQKQAKAAYDSYAVDDDAITTLTELVATAKAKSISLYTDATYEVLQDAIAAAEETIANPVTDANVTAKTDALNSAINSLELIDNAQEGVVNKDKLTIAIADARNLVDAMPVEDTALNDAIASAQTVLDNSEATQKQVDDALLALRAAVKNSNSGATLHFDAASSTGAMLHSATGALYGASEINIPSNGLIRAIEPKIMVQKAKDGLQHPSGDGYRLEKYLDASGAENVQIYIQDDYLQWPYENKGIDEYVTRAAGIVREMVADKSADEIKKMSFVLFNEPDGIWYGGPNTTQLCTDWKRVYEAVKNVDSRVQVAGPNFSAYHESAYEQFFAFCAEKNCLPEYITWHELQKDKLDSFDRHYTHMQGLIQQYYPNSGITPVICVNEVANFDDIGAPGALVNWLAMFEQHKTYACMAYWGLANSLNELSAEANKPNGAWWLYKWYAEMSGDSVAMTEENVNALGAYGRLYGLTSVDGGKQTAYTIFGGQAGAQTVKLENLKTVSGFEAVTTAHVKLYKSKLTGYFGFADSIPVIFEGNLPVAADGTLTIAVKSADMMDAYYAIVTPGTSQETDSLKTAEPSFWTATYEAETAGLIQGATKYEHTGGGDTVRSGRADVGNINSAGDGVKFTISVPKDGKYKTEIYYGTQAPNVNPMTLEYVNNGGQNRGIGVVTKQTMQVDNNTPVTLNYDSTVKWNYFGAKTVYLDLAAGEHTITYMYADNGTQWMAATLDKLDLTYVGETGDVPAAQTVMVEPEELLGRNDSFDLVQDGSKYTGAGAASGSGSFTAFVVAPEDGYYTISAKASGSGSLTAEKTTFRYAVNAMAKSSIGIDYLNIGSTALTGNVVSHDMGKVYLTAGVNELRLSGSGMVLDQITLELDRDQVANVTTVEAENATLSNNPDSDEYEHYNLPASKEMPTVVDSAYTSGGKAVDGFRGGLDNSISFTVDAPTGGSYILSAFYSNNEPAPIQTTENGTPYVHPYNVDLVERYAQISVNGGTPQTVYFKNTFSWDVFKNVIIDVKLNAGVNTITLSNDNSYKFSSVQDDFTPRFDKFVIAPLTASGTPSADTYTVTFDSQGGSAVSSTTVSSGTLATAPANPTRSGYTFAGWYKEAACTTPWSFATDAVTGNVTLFAKWTQNSSGGNDSDSDSGSGGSTTKPTVNPDGSTTTTTTRPNGDKVETTVEKNGDKTVVETKKDGTKTETVTGKGGAKSETVTKLDGSLTEKKTEANGTSTSTDMKSTGEAKVEAKIPAKAVDAAAEKGESVTLETPAGSIELPADMMKQFAGKDISAEITVTPSADGSSTIAVINLSVKAGNETVTEPVKMVIDISRLLVAEGKTPLGDGTKTIAQVTMPGIVAMVNGKIVPNAYVSGDDLILAAATTGTLTLVDRSKTFADVSNENWAYNAVQFVAARGIFQGTSDTAFSADLLTTRGTVMTVLARLEGVDTTAAAGQTWYDKGMSWAEDKGISDGTNPEGNVTREQFAAMLYRLASATKVTSGSLDKFSDAATVSDWAKDAMLWAVESGILSGKDGSALDPTGLATRAEVSAMIMRFLCK